MTEESTLNAVELATELTIAWLSNPNTRANAEEVPAFLAKMHQAVNDLASPAAPAPAAEERATEYTPAVTARKSLASKDHIISMIDGKPYKTLKRHLSGHGLTPAQYRERYNLKADYPMVSENYSEARRAMAHKIGLGQKGRAARAAKPAATVGACRSEARAAQAENSLTSTRLRGGGGRCRSPRAGTLPKPQCQRHSVGHE